MGKMRHLIKILILVCLFYQSAWAGIEMGQVPERIELKGESGGHFDGTAWSSDEFRGKVHVLFYVDPDKKDLNNEASEALRREHFSLERVQTWAIINMAATWLPNFAISSALKEKQKLYPTTIYLRDYKKVLVKDWGISDNNSDILAFDRQGRLIFIKEGRLDPEDITHLIRVIRNHLER